MKFHAVADIFPMMSPEEYESLKADIKQNGLLQPIWTYEDQIIDGRNRYNACKDLNISPTYKTWDGNGSLVAFVVSLNLQRRHLDSGQKAFVALEVEKLLSVEAKERQREALRRGNITKHLDFSINQNFDKSTTTTTESKLSKNEDTVQLSSDVVSKINQIFDTYKGKLPDDFYDDSGLGEPGLVLDVIREDRPELSWENAWGITEKIYKDTGRETVLKELEPDYEETETQNKIPQASEQAAKLTGTNRQYVQDAKFIQEKAPDVAEAVKSGTIKIYEAKKVATLPEEQRKVVIEKVQSGEKPSQAIHEAKQQDKVSKTTWTESELKRKELVERGHTVTAHQNNDVQLIAWAEANKKFVRIDRFSDWGNPFLLPGDGDRKTVIAHYKQYLLWRPTLIKRLDELKGKVLGCWCHPEECHGDAIIEVMLDDNPF